MVKSCAALSAAFVAALVSQRVFSGGRPAEKYVHLSFELSTVGRREYLYGENVWLAMRVENIGQRPMGYLQLQTHPRFIGGVDLRIVRNGQVVPEDEFRDPQCSHYAKPAELAPGATLYWRFSLSDCWQMTPLPAGHYSVTAYFDERAQLGDAPVRSTSNTLRFTVKPWKPKAFLEKRWAENTGQYAVRRSVRLVETTEGHSLVSWRAEFPGVRDTLHVLEVVPITVKPRLDSVWWAATDKACHIVCDLPEEKKRVLIVVDPATSSARVFDLEPGGPVHRAGAEAWVW